MSHDKIAELLALMDPNEAVLLLNLLGDSNVSLISKVLSRKDRERLLQVGPLVGLGITAATVTCPVQSVT